VKLTARVEVLWACIKKEHDKGTGKPSVPILGELHASTALAPLSFTKPRRYNSPQLEEIFFIIS